MAQHFSKGNRTAQGGQGERSASSTLKMGVRLNAKFDNGGRFAMTPPKFKPWQGSSLLPFSGRVQFCKSRAEAVCSLSSSAFSGYDSEFSFQSLSRNSAFPAEGISAA